MRSQKGFSLIESLVALVILSIVGLAFLGAITTAHRSTILANEKTTAASLAKSQMENIQDQPYYDSTADYVFLSVPSEYTGYSYRTPMVTNVSGTLHLQKVTITIERSGRAIYTLEDYKVDKGG